MAIEFNDLCRLCATKDESSKDLKDENNKNVLDMIQELLQIAINDDDKLPTKVCLSCEEKLVSYQLFIFECYQVQATLNKMFLEKIPHYPVKNEDVAVVNAVETELLDLTNISAIFCANIKNDQECLNLLPNNVVLLFGRVANFILHNVKIERDEQTAEDLENAINNQEIPEFDGDDFIKSDHDQESDGDLSDVNLATLKKIKLKKTKQNVISEENQMQLKEVLMNSNCTVKDFVKMQCKVCDKIVRPWNALRLHYAKIHKSEPHVSCICGFVIRSHSVLYKHVADHRVESRKYKKVTESDPEQDKYDHLKVRNFVRFACNVCEKQFHSWYRLKSHCEREHKIKPVAQCVCGVTLKSKSVLYKHVKDHKNPDVICCDKCPRITKSVAAMNKHKMRHVPKSERKFYCQTCNKIFTSKDTLKSHERSHIPVEERKIYECDICHLKFTTRCSATSHKRVVHDKIKSYVCDLCGYACGTGGELRQHRAIHSDDKPFVCNKCSKPFKTYSNLKTHMDTHEDTSYTCYVCSRVLNSRRTLKKHLLVHEDKCRYVCSYCNKAFKRRQTLKVHMYTHTGDKPLSCKWCEERFAYASTLRSHRLRFHPDKMPLHYNAYNAHIAMQQGYLKPDPAAGVVNVGKNDVEAI